MKNLKAIGALLAGSLLQPLFAGEVRTFSVHGDTFVVEDVSAEVPVYFRALRFNEATEQWNVDFILTNSGPRGFLAPVFISVESFSNTTGPLQPDGVAGSPPKPFYMLGNTYYGRGAVALPSGGASLPRSIALGFVEGAGAPALRTKVFAAPAGSPLALGLARTLNGAGQPLPNVKVFEDGPQEDRELETDAEYGVVTLGQRAGEYLWRFERDRHLPVWRQATLSQGAVQFVPNPRLAERSAQSNSVPVGVASTVTDLTGDVELSFSAGAFQETSVITITRVDGQTLPAPLPAGWSPVNALWFEGSVAPTQPVSARLRTDAQSGGDAPLPSSAALARWNPTTARWSVLELVQAAESNRVDVTLPGFGAYVLVVADPSPLAPPTPVTGNDLLAAELPPQPAVEFTATGTVKPGSSHASRVPEAVTGVASVTISNRTGALLSGQTLRTEVTESYRLQDGSERFSAAYDTFITGYRDAGGSLASSFPMRPRLLFGGEDLAEGKVRVDVLSPESFKGGIFETNGGVIIDGTIRVIAESGDVSNPQAVSLRRLTSTNFASLLANGQRLVGAFDLTVAGIVSNRALTLQMSNAPNQHLVLARVLSDTRVNGLEPVERFQTETNGSLQSLEPAEGERLPGLRKAGQYLLVQVPGPHTLVTGLVSNNLAGLAVRVNGQPWTTFTAADGSYRLIASTGAVQISVTDLASLDGDFADVNIADASSVVNLNFQTAPRGPRVISVSPPAGARNVSRVTPMTITFSEPVNPGTVLNHGIRLLQTNGQPVAAAVTLNLRNTVASLLPTDPLPAGQLFTLVLSNTVADLSGLTLEGKSEFTFETQRESVQSDLAKLTIFEPGATNLTIGSLDVRSLLVGFDEAEPNVVVAHGSAGSSEAEVPVILVNETTGQTSTVLSKPDGSFAGFIQAAEEDFISAVFVNANGTRSTVAAREQRFDDGRVGLYRAGGILEAESDGKQVQVIIEPEAIDERNVFKVEAMNLAQLLEAVQGQLPTDGKLLSALRFEIGGQVPEGEANVVFPFDPVAAGVDEPEKGAYALAIVRKTEDGNTVYEVVDKLKFEDGKLKSNTLPFLGFMVMFAKSALFGIVAESAASAVLTSIFVGKDGVTVSGKVEGLTGFSGSLPISKPLVGATVTLHTLEAGFRPRPGRLPAGITYATTGPDGGYAFLVPKTKFQGFAMSATHPRFDDIDVKPLSTFDFLTDAGGKIINFELDEPNNPIGSLKVSAASSPLVLPIGGPGTFEVIAAHRFEVPEIIIQVDSTVSLADGTSLGNDAVTLSNRIDQVTGRQRSARVTVLPPPGKVRVNLRVIAKAIGSFSPAQKLFIHALDFDGEPFEPTGEIAPADGNDSTGPMVVASFPGQGEVLIPGQPIRLIFNEPIDRSVLDSGVSLSGPNIGTIGLELSSDQLTLEVVPGNLQPSADYSLALSAAVLDLKGNPLDQEPGTPGPQNFNLDFRAPATVTRPLGGLTSGGGAIMHGQFIFALERSAGKEAVKIYDTRNAQSITSIAEFRLPDFPRDLVLITNYSYVQQVGGSVLKDRNILVVVGGTVTGGNPGGEREQVQAFVGQYMRVIDVTDPFSPQRLFGVIITRRNTVVSKIRWDPPFLAFLENGSDFKQVALIDFQEMVIGFLAPPSDLENFPENGTPGIDSDGNGDYVSPGDEVPIPPKQPSEFFGKKLSVTLERTTQHILDFDFDAAGYIGVTLTAGTKLNFAGEPVGNAFAPSYRTLSVDFENLPDGAGNYFFGQNARPKRLFTLPVRVPTNDTVELRRAALVSLAPDSDGVNRLELIDITLPGSPTFLGQIDFPEDLDLGLPQSISLRADGLVALAMSQHVVLLDPFKMIGAPPSQGRLHPAILSVLPSAGSGNITFGTSEAGLTVVNLGGRNELIQSAPQLRFVMFPSEPVFDPVGGPPTADEVARRMSNMVTLSALGPARLRASEGVVSHIDPPSPLFHYYVLVDGPGGQAGQTVITVGLESLNRSGFPLKNKGRSFPPVRALSADALAQIKQRPVASCDAPIEVLEARRLSDDPTSPMYNKYLSRPFALITERISASDLATFVSQPKRVILWSGFYLRGFIDVTENKPFFAPFASTVDGDRLVMLPGASVVAETLPGTYILGPNPPPANGHIDVPGTFGLVSAHNGEFRNETIDLVVPSRRMPIIFQRAIGGRDTYEGPFGLGWDHAYNESLTVLRPHLFDAGRKMPLVVRQLLTDHTTAETGDVILQNGAGRTILFKNKGESIPPEVQNDPLVQELQWNQRTKKFFLPDPSETGTFDLLFEFTDGQFARLTPDGTQFWYSSRGRLEKIYHRYVKNFHVLTYNERGELTRITDKSIEGDARFLDIGYFRLASDPLFDTGLDEQTSSGLVAGKIARLSDYTGRDVLYKYNEDGILEERLGPMGSGDHGGVAGRPKTVYLWNGTCGLEGVVEGGLTEGGGSTGGTPLFAAAVNSEGVVNGTGQGAGGSVSISVAGNNTAETVGNSTVNTTGPDNSSANFTFDKFGYPKEVRFSGAKAGPAAYKPTYENGLLKRMEFPEGNSVEYTYDSSSAVFRSRGNLLTIRRAPGARGGDELTASYLYDERYNLPSGQGRSLNGKSVTYTLRADGRDIEQIVYEAVPQAHEFRYNDFGQLEHEETPDGLVTDIRYENATGFKDQEIRGGAVTIDYGYDGSRAGELGVPTSVLLPRGASITAKYDDRLLMTEFERGDLVVRIGYDANGNPLSIDRTIGNGISHVETREYDQINFLRKITVHNVDIDGSTANLITEFIPDEARRIKTINYLNTSRHLEYDHLGNVTKMTIGDYFEEYEHDLHGNLKSVKKKGTETRTLTYDGHDRPVTVMNQVGQGATETISLSYFGNGERKSVTVTDGFGTAIEMEITDIDGLGRPKSETRQASTGPAATIGYDYAVNNGLAVVMDGPRETTTTSQDAAGRPTGESDSIANATFLPNDNGGVELITSSEDGKTYTLNHTYDDLDYTDSSSDPIGTLFTYDPRADGSVERITDGRNNDTIQEFTSLGERSALQRPEQIRSEYRYNATRQPTYTGDPAAGHAITYDSSLRAISKTLRSGGSYGFDAPNELNLPTSITFPGGSATIGYDLQGRMTSQDYSYTSAEGGYKIVGAQHDALGRVRSWSYGNGAQYSATFSYDKLGPLVSSTYNEALGSFTVTGEIYADGSRARITYPSGSVTILEDREPSGRLRAVANGSGQLARIDTYGGKDEPEVVLIGGGLIREENTYDARRRLLSRRYTATGSGQVLADLRYQYDAANNLTLRQEAHRHGRADAFQYDAANRLRRADVGLRPNIPGAVRIDHSGLQTPANISLAEGLYGRDYGFDGSGLDLLENVTAFNPSGSLLPPLPAFATTIAHDSGYLHAQAVDGFTRGVDPLGNTTRTVLQVRDPGGSEPFSMPATLTYNALSHLVKVERDDGVTIEYEYRPDGLMHHRKVTRGGLVVSDAGFVYDQGVLLEEYQQSGNQVGLRAQYYYMDEDCPFAADIVTSAGITNRFFYLKDVSGSVVAVANENGEVVEQVHYDPWGQPEIKGHDTLFPAIRAIHRSANGILVQFSELVMPRPGAGQDFVTETIGYSAAFELTGPSGPIALSRVSYEEDLPGFPFGTVFRVEPATPLPPSVTLNVQGGFFVDEWSLTNRDEEIVFNTGGSSVLFQSATTNSTAGPRIAQSALGSPFLFHGQYFDYAAGLVYLRARFYDPYTGHFLQRDPEEYADSVNHYAGLGNAPTTNRDPTGTRVAALRALWRQFAKKATRAKQFLSTGTTAAKRLKNIKELRAIRDVRLRDERLVQLKLDRQRLGVLNEEMLGVQTDEGLRAVLVVRTSRGPQAFYKSTGRNSGSERAGVWEPFEGVDRHSMYFVEDGRITIRAFEDGNLMFNKGGFAVGRSSGDRLRRFGDPTAIHEEYSEELLQISNRLGQSRLLNDFSSYHMIRGFNDQEFATAAVRINRLLFRYRARAHPEIGYYFARQSQWGGGVDLLR